MFYSMAQVLYVKWMEGGMDGWIASPGPRDRSTQKRTILAGARTFGRCWGCHFQGGEIEWRLVGLM